MIIFLPVSRFKINYQVAAGRPYSAFEQLLLQAVGDGCSTLESLRKIFCVHRRIIIDAVVTLMQAGWVAIEQPLNHFALTDLGFIALKSQGGIPKCTTVADRSDYMVMERVMGQVAKSNEVWFYDKKALQAIWDAGVRAPRSDMPPVLEPGQVAALLAHDAGEWIRWIGPITLVRENVDFIVLDADIERNLVTGIPKPWELLLSDHLITLARSSAGEFVEADIDIEEYLKAERDVAPPARHFAEANLQLTEDDLVCGTSSNRELLRKCIADAESYLLILSSDLNSIGINDIIPALVEAAKNGVLIDILWAREYPDVDSEAALDLLRRAEYQLAHSVRPVGRISVAKSSSSIGSSNVILFDKAKQFIAVVGSYAWLHPVETVDRGVSIRLEKPELLSPLCYSLLDLLSADEKLRMGAGITRLQSAAAQSNAQVDQTVAMNEADTISVRLVMGLEYRIALQTMLANVHTRFILTTRNLESGCEADLLQMISSASRARSVEILYEISLLEQHHHDELVASVNKLGAILAKSSDGARGYVIVDDDDILVGEFPWCELSQHRNRRSEIGIWLHGANIVNMLARKLKAPQPPV